MKTILKSFAAFTIVFTTASCEKSFLYEDQSSDPQSIFDAVWTDMDEYYSGFQNSTLQWEKLYGIYNPMIGNHISNQDLWNVLSQMLNELDDEHVKLYDDITGKVFISGNDKALQAASEFNLELVASKYLTEVSSPNNYILHGKMAGKQNVGYIFIAAFLDENPGLIGSVLQQMDYQNLDAIIIDLRTSIGGYDGLAAEYAAYFSDGRHHVYNSQFKDGHGRNDFTAPKAYYTKSPQSINFTKPIILLADAATASEAEIFTLNMRSFAHVAQMGDTTAGALSTVGPARFLANGWRYEYSIQRITNPDGSTFEKFGIPPVEYVQNKETDILNGEDKVLEESLHYLQQNFGI
jgi:carboxyl-terminal processing protease